MKKNILILFLITILLLILGINLMGWRVAFGILIVKFAFALGKNANEILVIFIKKNKKK